MMWVLMIRKMFYFDIFLSLDLITDDKRIIT